MAALVTGTQAPGFDLPGTDGNSHSLEGLAGKRAVVVVFTCNHCPYAKAWEDRLIAVAGDYAGREVGVLAISPNDPVQYPEDSLEEMRRRAQAKNYPFPYLFDETQDVARAYGAERTPEVFLLDAERQIRYHGAIDDDQDETQVTAHYLHDALDAVLAGAEPPVNDTPPVGCTIKWK